MVTTLTLQATDDLFAGAEYRLIAPATCVVGREASCDLRLSEGVFTWAVSRRHCQIEVTSRAAFVRDLGSRNGTFLNGHNIGQRPRSRVAGDEAVTGPWHELADGDILRVGDLVFGVRIRVDAVATVEERCSQYAGA